MLTLTIFLTSCAGVKQLEIFKQEVPREKLNLNKPTPLELENLKWIIITSNNEKELPDAFLRRCFFHYINFPDRVTMQKIINVHFPKIKKKLVDDAMDIFFDVRKIPGLKKKPSTSELVDWLKLIMSDDIPEDILTNRDPTKAIPPLYGALLKNEQDVHLLERLAFMTRREQR